MEGGVAVGGGCIWVSHMLQQQLDNICFSQTGGNVKGRLVLLWLEDEVVQMRVNSTLAEKKGHKESDVS